MTCNYRIVAGISLANRKGMKLYLQTKPVSNKLRGWPRLRETLRRCNCISLVIEVGRKPAKSVSKAD